MTIEQEQRKVETPADALIVRIGPARLGLIAVEAGDHSFISVTYNASYDKASSVGQCVVLTPEQFEEALRYIVNRYKDEPMPAPK